MINQDLPSRVFLGEAYILMDLAKIYSQYTLCYKNTFEEIQEILVLNSDNKYIFFIDKTSFADRDQIIKFLKDYDGILLIEESDHIVMSPKQYIDKISLIKILCQHFNINYQDKFLNIEKNIYDSLFQFKITKQIPNFTYINQVDNITFFRKKLFSLKYAKYSPEKRDFLKAILYRLEHSFKTTGIKGLFSYYLMMEKFVK